MKKPGADVRGDVRRGACLAGRIVVSVETSRSPREDYPRCSVGGAVCGESGLGGMGGKQGSGGPLRGGPPELLLSAISLLPS